MPDAPCPSNTTEHRRTTPRSTRSSASPRRPSSTPPKNPSQQRRRKHERISQAAEPTRGLHLARRPLPDPARIRSSEEHTSELQSRFDLVCRLLLEKK